MTDLPLQTDYETAIDLNVIELWSTASTMNIDIIQRSQSKMLNIRELFIKYIPTQNEEVSMHVI